MSGQTAENKPNSDPAAKFVGPDHRYLPRWEVKNRILYKLEDQEDFQEASSRDLSCTGACVLVPETLPKSKKVKMTIYLTEDESVDVQGEVVWNHPQQGQNLAGILFHNTSPKTQELILKHAFEIKKNDLVKHWFSGWNP